MKELLAGVVILLVLGLGAFFYRSIVEHVPTPIPEPPATVSSS